jgi:hypothetical protein
MTAEEAIKLSETKFWEHMSPKDVAAFQLNEKRLCMPFGVFREAVEKALGRPVSAHEFAFNPDGLRAELAGDREALSLADILELIPKEKRVVVVVDPAGPEES